MAANGTIVVPGVWDVPSAAAARAAGARELFLSGSALASSLGLPDLGLVSATELVAVAGRIVSAIGLPLVVDAETGYGPPPALARLTESLVGAGVAGMMLEDQEYAGQSVAAEPGLCAPETMAARARLARAVGGPELKLLARTDILGADWPLDEVLRRLELYLEAGADWAMPVYLRSAGELERAAALAPGRVVALAAPGAGGYVPTLEEARAAGLRALLVVGQHRAVLPKLLEIYERGLSGEPAEQMSAADVDRLTGAARYRAHA